jgi:hypothetical protein
MTSSKLTQPLRGICMGICMSWCGIAGRAVGSLTFP